MNLNTIEEVRSATAVDGGAVEWREGDSWLAGGTWLFSEPQPHLRRLLDLRTLGWPPLEVERRWPAHRRHLHDRRPLRLPRAPGLAGVACDRRVLPLLPRVVQDLEHGHRRRQHLHVAAGRSDDLADGVAGRGLHAAIARRQRAPGAGRSTSSPGNHQNVLLPGELLRTIDLPASALRKRAAFRRMSLTHMGRSTALADRHGRLAGWRRSC